MLKNKDAKQKVLQCHLELADLYICYCEHYSLEITCKDFNFFKEFYKNNNIVRYLVARLMSGKERTA